MHTYETDRGFVVLVLADRQTDRQTGFLFPHTAHPWQNAERTGSVWSVVFVGDGIVIVLLEESVCVGCKS